MEKPQDMTFAEQIKLIRSTDIGVPRRLDIDLSVAAVDHEYSLAANVFYVFDAPDGQMFIDVRFNKLNQAQHRFYRQTGLMTPMHTIFVTTPAGQTGTMTIIYGTEAPALLRIIDNRSATSLDMAAVRAELQGDTIPENWDTEITVGSGAAVEIINANADRKACTIQAKSTNTGIVYIGFDNTVTATKWIAQLQASQTFSVSDYRGDLWARASAAGQLVGWGEW